MYLRKRKQLTALLAAACIALSATGCANDNAASSGTRDAEVISETSTASAETQAPESGSAPDVSADTITIIDHAGNEVTLPREIHRIAVGNIYPLPSVLSVFFDSAEKIVAMPQQSMAAAQNSLLGELYPEILHADTGFIDGTSINLEELIALDPDVVFYSADSTENTEALMNSGIPAVAVSASKWDYDAVETLHNWIALLGQIFPENEKSALCDEYSLKMQDLINERTANLTEEQRKNVFFLFQYSDANITTSGKHFFGQFWANAIGAKNVGAEMENKNSAAVSMEQIYAWNPDIIFVTNYTTATPADLYENKIGNYDWSAVNAVKNQRVYKMPLGMYRSYTAGIDTPVTLLWLAKAAYPDLFEDIDITAETQKYYKDIFGIELTAEQANQIFAPSADASAY